MGPEVIVPVVMFGGGALVGISFSPVGRAFARRIAADKVAEADAAALAEVDALRDDVQTLRHEVGDLQERLDFAERLLAQVRDKGLLGRGGA